MCDESEIDKALGQWLKERRLKKGFSLEHASFLAKIPTSRLMDLELGQAVQGIRELEVLAIAKAYGVDPRAIRKRATSGDEI